MSEIDQGQEAKEKKAAPETLELRARPQPVTRINRKVLIGGAAVFLMLLSGIVLVALKPRRRPENPDGVGRFITCVRQLNPDLVCRDGDTVDNLPQYLGFLPSHFPTVDETYGLAD